MYRSSHLNIIHNHITSLPISVPTILFKTLNSNLYELERQTLASCLNYKLTFSCKILIKYFPRFKRNHFRTSQSLHTMFTIRLKLEPVGDH